MAAPADTTWGSIVGGKGRIGISRDWTDYTTYEHCVVKVWFWSKWSVSDSVNEFSYGVDSMTSRGSRSISHTVDSGEWSESNQTLLGAFTHDFYKDTSDKTHYLKAQFSGIDIVGGTMTAERSYTVFALPTYTVTFTDGLGNVLKTQTVSYGYDASPPSNPTRDGYIFAGWSGTYTNITSNQTITATWTQNTFIVKFYDRGTLLKTETVSYGGSATPPSVGQRLGWHFTEWDKPYDNITKNVDISAKWDKNKLIVNYYSNYANKVRDSKNNNTIKTLDSTKNVFIRQDTYTYGNPMEDTLRNYSGHNNQNTLVMRRHGYLPTRYWNTQPNGTGYSLHEGAGTPETDTVPNVEQVARWLGVNIDYNNATVNVYPQWTPQTELYIMKDGTVYAGDFIISSSSSYIDKNGMKIYAPNFTTGSSSVQWSSSGLTLKERRWGSPDFPTAATI